MSTFSPRAFYPALCFALFCAAPACAPSPADGSGEANAENPSVYEIESARIPRITSVSPPSASNIGGTQLTITGKSFEPGAQVFGGGVQATWVTINSSTQLTMQTPLKTQPVGPVDVKVVNPDGRQSDRSDVLTLFNDNVAPVAQRSSTPLTNTIFAVADMNGDGRQDLLIAQNSGALLLYLNVAR